MTVGNILGACENSVKSIAPVAAACILAGIIMGSMSLTGFGLKISSLIEMISGGNLLFALLLSMAASLLLGMGLPTSAAYMVLSLIHILLISYRVKCCRIQWPKLLEQSCSGWPIIL